MAGVSSGVGLSSYDSLGAAADDLGLLGYQTGGQVVADRGLIAFETVAAAASQTLPFLSFAPRRRILLRPRGRLSQPFAAQAAPPPGQSRLRARLSGLQARGRQWCVPQSQSHPPLSRNSPTRRVTLSPHGRTLSPVPPQVPVPQPVWPTRVSLLARRLFAVQPRGKRNFPTQPQVPVPPTIPGNRMLAGRKLTGFIRGRRAQPPTADQAAPIRTSRRVFASLLRRGRPVSPVSTQVAVTPPAWPPGRTATPRRLLSGAQRGRQVTPTPAQVPVPLKVPQLIRSIPRPSFLRRGRQVSPVPAQQAVTAPPFVPSPRTAARRLAAPLKGRRLSVPADQATPVRPARSAPKLAAPPARRSRPAPSTSTDLPSTPQPKRRSVPSQGHGRRWLPTPPQIPVPLWPPRIIRSLPRWGWLRRGRKADPAWPQQFPTVVPDVAGYAADSPLLYTSTADQASLTGYSVDTAPLYGTRADQPQLPGVTGDTPQTLGTAGDEQP